MNGTDTTNAYRGVFVYAIVAIVGATIVAAALRAMHLSVGDRNAFALVLAAMWIPSLARLVATSTVDRGWRSPLPLTRWGRPRLVVMLMPLVTVSVIYIAAYVLARAGGVATEPPVWHGAGIAFNIAVNLPLLAVIGGIGAIGEELGWRGYLQLRLDQLGVRGSLLWVIVVETAFHTPLILLAGYLGSDAQAASIALFFGLGVGLTTVWTWATYRWRSLWVAVWFHVFHNAVSQVLAPKAFGAGDPLVLGESGIFPVLLYLMVAIAVLSLSRAQGHRWHDLARLATR